MTDEELDDLPCESGRHRNKAAELLGKVYRHKTDPPNEWPEIGVVEVQEARKWLSYYIALSEHWERKATPQTASVR